MYTYGAHDHSWLKSFWCAVFARSLKPTTSQTHICTQRNNVTNKKKLYHFLRYKAVHCWNCYFVDLLSFFFHSLWLCCCECIHFIHICVSFKVFRCACVEKWNNQASLLVCALHICFAFVYVWKSLALSRRQVVKRWLILVCFTRMFTLQLCTVYSVISLAVKWFACVWSIFFSNKSIQ